jgi:radical SAM protein with 4Fe4S-binding SPASM domain
MLSLNKTLKFLREHNIPTLRSPFVPRGAGESIKEIAFDSTDIQEIINPALRRNPLNYVSFTPFFASPEYMEKTWKLLEIPISTFGCQAARGFIGINAEGDVAPCVHLLDSKLDCGNVRITPLSEIMETNQTMLDLADGSKVKGKCGKCRYKHSCRGCRALAYYATGDPLEADPACFFEPEDENTCSEYEAECDNNVAEFIRFLALNKPWNRIFRPTSLWAKIKVLFWLFKNKKKQVR